MDFLIYVQTAGGFYSVVIILLLRSMKFVG